METDETCCDSCMKTKCKTIKKYVFRCEPRVDNKEQLVNAQKIFICDDMRLMSWFVTSTDGFPRSESESHDSGKDLLFIFLCNSCYKKSSKNLTFNVGAYTKDKTTSIITKPCIKVTQELAKKRSDKNVTKMRLELLMMQFGNLS